LGGVQRDKISAKRELAEMMAILLSLYLGLCIGPTRVHVDQVTGIHSKFGEEEGGGRRRGGQIAAAAGRRDFWLDGSMFENHDKSSEFVLHALCRQISPRPPGRSPTTALTEKVPIPAIAFFTFCAGDARSIPDFEIGQRMLNKADTLLIRERGLTFV
jgi:hypothetical protein